jgi:hypothetical protein
MKKKLVATRKTIIFAQNKIGNLTMTTKDEYGRDVLRGKKLTQK